MQDLAEFAPALALVFGLLVGSFLNVVILRLPPRLEFGWRRDAREVLELPAETGAPPVGIVVEPSHCPKCGHGLSWYENIPLLSWLLLRGRCRDCKAPISIQYPLVEALTGLVSAWVIYRFGATAAGGFALVFSWFLIAAAGIDARTTWLPDPLTLPLLWLGLIAASFGVFVDPVSAIWGAVGGYLSLWSIFWGFKLLTGKDGMGYGDFKLLAALGAFTGWQGLLPTVLMASLIGAVVGGLALWLQDQDRQTPIPFGPFLAFGGWMQLMFGGELVAKYFQLMGMH
ncbi:MAG: prepilin peptidase [Lysobacterales bacterium CG02_land_8_20_14_3_00_62_12]|nr:MAG: prepilin peptidase [Xanthomonadales bacterium CG02_land_8_20_14_3_00_62_12]